VRGDIDEQRAYDHFRWATRYGKTGMQKKANSHLDRAMHYGTLGSVEAFMTLGASATERSTGLFPERSAKVRYAELKETQKNPVELDRVQRAYDWLVRANLIDPVDERHDQANKRPRQNRPKRQKTGSDTSLSLRDLECQSGILRPLSKSTTSVHEKHTPG
jgi:hypothetical protein